MVIVSPLTATTHDSFLSIRLPSGFKKKQSNVVIELDDAPQLSMAVAVNEIGASFGVMVAGELHWISGGVVSTTVTVKLHVLWLPALSVAVQVFMVLPRGKVEPEGSGVQLGVISPEQLSVAVVLKETKAPSGLVQSTVSLAGQVISGGVVSTTVTVPSQESKLIPSLTVNVTIVLPRE